jgi:hypothetical protein
LVTALIVLAVVACGFAVAEVGLRWADDVALRPFGNLAQRRLCPFPPYEGLDLSIYHPVLGWTIAPRLHVYVLGAFLTTDDFGTRLPSAECRPLPHGSILASGSSFTAGAEVGDEHTWPALLESLLGEPVVNAAAGGWGTDQTILRAEEMIELIHPSTVILGFSQGAMQYSELRSFGGAQKPYYLINAGALELHNVPVPISAADYRLVRWLRPLIERCYLIFRAAHRLRLFHRPPRKGIGYRPNGPEGAGVEISCLLLDQLKTLTHRRGIRLVLLMEYGWNEFEQAEPPAPSKRVLDWARAAGIETVDAWARMKRLFEEDRQAFLDLYVHRSDGKIGHMSETGNRLVATEVARALQRAS